jgi:hypothetical protein
MDLLEPLQSISFIGYVWWEWPKAVPRRQFNVLDPPYVSVQEFVIQIFIALTAPFGGIGFLIVFLYFQPKAGSELGKMWSHYVLGIERYSFFGRSSSLAGGAMSERSTRESSSLPSTIRYNPSLPPGRIKTPIMRPETVSDLTEDSSMPHARPSDASDGSQGGKKKTKKFRIPGGGHGSLNETVFLVSSLKERESLYSETDEDALCRVIDFANYHDRVSETGSAGLDPTTFGVASMASLEGSLTPDEMGDDL